MTAATPPLSRAEVLHDAAPSLRAERGAARLADLAQRTASLRGRRSGVPAERWLVVAGAVAIPLGLLLILLGWYGSARTAVPFEQTPYLISGGLLGLALVVIGSALYFAQWTTTLVREARRDRDRAAAHEARVEELLTVIAAAATEPAPVRLPEAAVPVAAPVAPPVPPQPRRRAAAVPADEAPARPRRAAARPR